MAQSNSSKTIEQMYEAHENEKKRAYNARILQIEKGTFSPIVFSCTGGVGKEAARFLKQLALLWSRKKGEEYSDSISYIRKRYCFDIIRTCVLSFRGERKSSAQSVVKPVKEMELSFI